MEVTHYLVEYLDDSGQVFDSEYVSVREVLSPEEEAREARAFERQAAMFVVSLLPAYYLLFKVRQLTPKLALPPVRLLEEFFQWSRARVESLLVMSHWVAVQQIAQNLISKLMTRVRRCFLLRALACCLGKEVQS